MSIAATIPVYLLQNTYALNHFLREGVEEYLRLSPEKRRRQWREWAYLAFYARDSSRPEHVFDERWKLFPESRARNGYSLLANALRMLGEEYLCHDHGQLCVKTYEQYERWLNLHARLSLFPVIETQRAATRNTSLESLSPDMSDLILYPYNKRVEHLIAQQGLNEMHLHLYACITAEEVWLYDLYHENEHKNELKKREEWIAPMLRQVDPQLTIHELVRRMQLAAVLRARVIDMLSDDPSGRTPSGIIDIMRCYRENRPVDIPTDIILRGRDALQSRHLDTLIRQERWMWRCYSRLHPGENKYYTVLSTTFHLYLLLMNQFVSLVRFRENQTGLQEFCKISSFPRELNQHDLYVRTFRKCARHIAPSARNKIEVRFSPPADLASACHHIIDGAYSAHVKSSNRRDHLSLRKILQKYPLPYQLILVEHLIKKESAYRRQTRESERIRQARKAYFQSIGPLVAWYKQRSDADVPIGLDVAGAEHLLPVDAFVPAFKRYNLCNTQRRTFHCGEDFRHLITGIRTVYDVIHLLDFRPGNRLGHAVALGIHPKCWLEAVPQKMVLTRREWLLDLICCRLMLLRGSLPNETLLYRVEEELSSCATYVFGSDHGVSFDILRQLYDARALLPEVVGYYLWKRQGDTGGDDIPYPFLSQELLQREEKQVRQFEQKNGLAPLHMFHRWEHDAELRARLDEQIEVPADFLREDELIVFQQRMQQYVRDRGIVIESLPISNFRIAPYRRMQDLHILRWLHVDGCWVEGDCEMDICIGSDDPGLFATDIKSEYYLLFCLMKMRGLSDAEAVTKLSKLNETGSIYAFDAINDERLRSNHGTA